MNTTTNQPPEWAVKAANEVLEQLFKLCGIVASDNVTPDLATIIASHAPKNQRLVDAVIRAEHFLSSVAGHKHVICGNEGQVEIDGVWIDCADIQNEFRSALKSAERK